mgnify:CR=1 FL=1
MEQAQGGNRKELGPLKARLDAFIERSAIAAFESDDIIELVTEGESLEWILDRLGSGSPAMNREEGAALLEELRALVGPAPELQAEPEAEPEDAGDAAPGAPAPPGAADLAGLDFGELLSSLPPGVKLPPGMSLGKIRELMESPQGKAMSDFLLFCQERGIEMNERAMTDPRTAKLQEEWKNTPRPAFDGKTPAEAMEDGQGIVPDKVETFRREEPRVGRNDPCPCGSGKKFKKCCGRASQ